MTPEPTNLAPESDQHPASIRMMLRHHAVSRIVNETLAQHRVYDNRPDRPEPEEQPCVYVHTKDEAASRFGDAPTEYERTLTLWIDIYASATPMDVNPVDLVDVIAAQAERQMLLVQHDITAAQIAAREEGVELGWGFNPDKSGLQGTSMDTDAEGRQLDAGARITWNLVYVQQYDETAFLPEEITPMSIAGVKWDVDGDGAVDAEDDIELAQD